MKHPIPQLCTYLANPRRAKSPRGSACDWFLERIMYIVNRVLHNEPFIARNERTNWRDTATEKANYYVEAVSSLVKWAETEGLMVWPIDFINNDDTD